MLSSTEDSSLANSFLHLSTLSMYGLVVYFVLQGYFFYSVQDVMQIPKFCDHQRCGFSKER